MNKKILLVSLLLSLIFLSGCGKTEPKITGLVTQELSTGVDLIDNKSSSRVKKIKII